MREVSVASRKWDGTFHRRMRAAELGSDRAGTWLWIPDGSLVEVPGGSFRAVGGLRLLRAGQSWSAYFTPARPELGRPKQLYVDITTPTTRVGDTFELVDLDLDVEQLDDGAVEILDRDEFVRHAEQQRYPPEVVEAAEETCERVAASVRRREPPFDGSHQRWLRRGIRGSTSWGSS